MELEILQSNLRLAISLVYKAISPHSQIPTLNNFLLQATKSRLQITATDLEIAWTAWIGAKVKTEGEVLVDARILSEFVSGLPAGKLTFSSSEQQLTLSCGRHRANLATSLAKEYPRVVGEKETKAGQPLPLVTAKEGFEKVVFAAAVDDSRPALTSVNFHLTDGLLSLISTDGYRLSKWQSPIKSVAGTTDISLLIPAKAIREIVRLIDGAKQETDIECAWLSKKGQLVITSNWAQLVVKLIDGQYPDWQKIWPDAGTTILSLDREDLQVAVKLAAVFARDGANIVKLETGKNLLVVSANAKQVGDNRTEIEAKVNGEPVSVAFNSKYLLDLLSIVDTGQLRLSLSGGLKPGLFEPVTKKGSPSFQHIIMPVRVRE